MREDSAVVGSAEPARPVWQLPVEDAADSDLRHLNATAADFPRGQCLHELVEAQAARTPAARAVESVSYTHLTLPTKA